MRKNLVKILISISVLGILLYWIAWFTMELRRPSASLVNRPYEEVKKMIVQETNNQAYDSMTAELERIEGNTVTISGIKYKLKTPIKIVKDEGDNRNADATVGELKAGDMVQGFYVKDKLDEGFVFLKLFKF